jgi:RNA polymerase sigma-70 factor (ECF subfamily)
MEWSMSSETVYFPDALATTPAVNRHIHGAPEGSSKTLDVPGFHSDLTELPATVITANSEISDELLLKQVGDGDKEALALLFRRFARNVRNVAYRILRSEAEADDLVQEVFLFIFRKAALFNASGGAARSWIFRVTYHRGFDRRRYLNSRHFYDSLELLDTSFRVADTREELPFHERSMEGILGKPLMARFNRRLSPEQRETIQLYFFEGYALTEIAQLTGRPLCNVRQHYYRGLEKMRQYVLPEKFGRSE